MSLELYDRVRAVPKEAQKTIGAGRLKGMTDINPMWRIKTLTEQFGVCGFGWYYTVDKSWTDTTSTGEITVSVEISLYIKDDEEWSKPIYGIGGSKLAVKESSGIYTDDEAYKKATTDALSVACKSLGIGADIYWDKDSTKYTSPKLPETVRPVESPRTAQIPSNKSKLQVINELSNEVSVTFASIKEWIAATYGKSIPIDELTDEQYSRLVNKLEKTRNKHE